MTKSRGRAKTTRALESAKDNGSSEEESDKVGEILSRLPDDTPPEVVELITQSALFSGPIPPPAMFAQYEEALPGAADRIMKLAENEQEIRRRDNGWILLNDSFRVGGSIIVSLALIGAGVYCGVIDQPELGGALGVSGAVTGVVRYFNHKSPNPN